MLGNKYAQIGTLSKFHPLPHPLMAGRKEHGDGGDVITINPTPSENK
jgi:hypothetical protein